MSAPTNLRLPEKNDEIRLNEKKMLHGEEIVVNLRLSAEDVIPVSVTISREVGYVKSIIATQLDVPFDAITMKYKGTPMIDPLSFCDHPGVAPPSIDVDVEIAM